MNNKLALFEEKQIRKTWQENKWYFSIEDVVYALTDSKDSKQYVKKLKARDDELQNNWGTICTPLEMLAKDGKRRKIQIIDSYSHIICIICYKFDIFLTISWLFFQIV